MTTAYEGGSIPPIRLRYRLRIAREEAGLDQHQLAERMGVGRNVVSNAENGRTWPRKITLNAWALACGVPISWLEKGQGRFGPPEDDGPVRPKGFEPLTFWLGADTTVTRMFPRPVPDLARDSVPA